MSAPGIVSVAIVFGALLTPAAHAAALAPDVDQLGKAIVPIIDRPAIHSYQPYDTLQFGFRPDPPVFRGVTSPRPEIRMPRRRPPLIEYGAQSSDAAQWYAYCADRFDGGIEPRQGPYGPHPVEPRCPD